MSNYEKLGLYEHNIRSYEKVKEQFENDNIAAIVHATGTGKSFNALQLALDNKDKKIIYIVPYGSIIEHEKELIEQNNNVSLENDFPNLEFRTYQSFINMSEEEISELEVDLLILDEFHHIGAPIWGARINTLVDTHENLQIFGMTAYTVRDRGTSYERDMVNPETDELFSNKVVSNYDLCDAMIDGVLPKPNYKSGYVFLEETCEFLESKINSLNPNSKDYQELAPLLKDLKKRIHEAPGLSDIFKTNIKTNGKYIYFCPLNSEQGVNDMDSIMSEARNWIHEMGLTEDDYEFYMTTSDMGEDGKKNRDAFYNDKDLEQNDTSNRLRIMFAINQYNEGVHAPGLNGVIMGRSTQSDIIFFEQLGRALSVGHDTKSDYEEYYLKSKEELIEECKRKELTYNETMSKEELTEILVAPIIIDLSNNIGFIKDLENNLKDRIKEYQLSEEGTKREIHLKNASFNIDMINEDLFKIVEFMRDRLTMTWMDKYELAKAYYEHHGNLEIPTRFKTINGYEYDEKGIQLGLWILNQRQAYKGTGSNKITKEQVELLKKIGMRFNSYNDEKWMQNYELAKVYYEHHGNLEIPTRFKTINGYEYDEKGIKLGSWISEQRQAYKNNGRGKITKQQIKLLEEIGMRFGSYIDELWNQKYELAKIYFNHYGNLEMTGKFKTVNGYEYDENGIKLGLWILNQRQALKKGKVTDEQLKLLKEIGMIIGNVNDEKWMQNYKLAKAYYEYYGNLEIPQDFRTINGYEYDESGKNIGDWISNQRQAYKNNGRGKITEQQIKLLEEIGMRFIDYKDEKWMQNFELAKAYYEHHGNLEIPQNFKTINGYEYDEKGSSLSAWISNQRQAYRKGILSIEHIELLKGISLIFENVLDEKWNQSFELAKKYYEHYNNLKIPDSYKTLNGYEYDENGIKLGIWIALQRQAFIGNGTSKLTEERIKKLDSIGMIWLFSKKDSTLQSELINKNNITKKNIEILNRMKSYLNSYDDSEMPTRDELERGFIEQLNSSSRKK